MSPVARRTLLASGAVAAAAPLLASCAEEEPPTLVDRHDYGSAGGDVLVTDVVVFDGERFTGHDAVAVRGGLIAEVGGAGDLPVFDGGGRVLIPGLIDAHAHNSGSNARGGLRFGVTAMLDMYGRIDPRLDGRADLGEHRHADVWWAGWGLTVPGGHPAQWFPEAPTVSVTAEVEGFVDERVSEGSDFLKIVVQRRDFASTVSQGEADAGVEAAHAHGMLAVAHAGGWDDALVAARAGVDVLVHLPVGEKPDREALDLLAERGTPVVATLTVTSGARCEHDVTAFLEDPAIAGRLDKYQRAEADLYPDACDRRDHDWWREASEASFQAVRDAGLPLLVGTDSGNAPVVTGVSVYHELELLAERGVPVEAALAGATSLTADAFGLAERGRIAPGKRGDLVLLEASSPEEVIGTYGIAAVWKNGHAVDLEVPEAAS